MAYQSEIEKLEQRFKEKPEQWFAALADAYRKNGDLELALELVQTWIAKRPNYTSGHIVHGRVLLDKGQDPEAAQVFERVLEVDAENIIAIRSLSEIAERRGDSQAAQTWIQRLLEIDPMNEEALAALERLKSAPPPPAAPSPTPEPAPAAGAATSDAAVAGFQPTALGQPPATEPPAVEPAQPEPAETAGELVVERASEPPGGLGDEAEAVELDSAVEEFSLEEVPTAGEAPADDVGFEPMEFEAPSAEGVDAESPVSADGEAGGADLDLAPFDDSLGWGTGERTSREISAADLEEATQLHEQSIEEVPHELLEPAAADATSEPADVAEVAPGAEEAEEAEVGGVGEVEFEEWEIDSAPSAPAAAEDDEGGDVDLPLIMPEDMETTPDDEPGEREPEPVLTETMAELYAKQGLMGEARDIYRRLVRERPGEPGLQRRLAELEQAAAARPRETAPAAQGPRYSADNTGGRSVRDYLQALLVGQAERPSHAPHATSEPETDDHTSSRDAAEVEPAMAMDSAFDEAGEPQESVEGAPTQPAGDEVSLAAVFGDEPAARPPAPPPEPTDAKQPDAGGEVAYDEFFDSGEGGAEGGSESGSSDSGETDTDFQQWLKGLKT